MGLKSFLCGFVFCLLIVGCAGATFPYKVWGLAAKDFSGTLLGPEPKDDLDLSLCKPVEGNATPCVIMFSDTYIRAKMDYIDTKNRIIELQRRCDRQGH